MSETEKSRAGKNALLEELESIRSMLDDESSTGTDGSTSDESAEEQTPRMPSQIPLLQDVIEPEIPDQSLLSPDGMADSDSQRGPDMESPVPDELYQQEELLMFTEDLQDEVADPDEVGSAYTEYQYLDAPDDAAPPAPGGLSELSSIETDELIDSLIAEHVDEILNLFKSILRDNLSLMMAQFRDTRTGSTDPVAGDSGDQEPDLPGSGGEDSNWNL